MSVPVSNMIITSQPGDSALATDKELVAVRAAQQAEALASGLPAYGKQGTDLLQFHHMMRGRYRLAITLLLIGAIAGTIIGFKCGKKTYASRGMIEVKAVIPKVLYSVDDKGALPMFDSYVESQAAWLRGQEVVDQAMLDPRWQTVRPGTSDLETEEFSKELTITHEGQIIYVTVVDPDPNAALTAVQTLIDAYSRMYKTKDLKYDEDRNKALKDEVQRHEDELNSLHDRIIKIANRHGTDDLKPLVLAKLEQMNKVEAAIQDQNMALSMATAKHAPSATQPTQTAATIEELAAENPALAQLVQQGEALDEEVERYKSHSLGDKSQSMLEALAAKKRIAKKIDDLAARLQAERASGVRTVTSGGVAVNSAEIEASIKMLTDQKTKLDGERINLGQEALEIEDFKRKAAEHEAARDTAQHHIDELRVEQTISARIEVLSNGDRPRGFYRNTQIPFSAAGGFGGAFLGFGIVALLALMDQRLRSPGHAEVTRFNAPILGMLPRLPDDLEDPAHASMAAHCVHEIRTLMQIWNRQSMHRVFGITSPHAGAGKTTLTLALGASYAASNLRTLLVDCDLVAGGLTHRLDSVIPRDFGDILIREGLVKEHQMNATAKIAGNNAEQQGEMLVTWNVITPEQKERAFELTIEEPIGILDAIHGMPISRCVQETGIRNLFIMPVGSATSRDVPLLSPEALHRLLSQLGREFDVVIVDSGPILGSLEASLVAGAVDGVVLTVAKGDRRPMVERAMAQLATVGARVAGMVFNGASVDELIAYGNGSSNYYGSPASRATSSTTTTTVPSHYGPLTCAVATSAPAIRRNSVVRTDE